MPLYRLLRSNKESGPYSLNDLVVLGLKPYDLVWVDGRSAAWRYPSEITELKEYAPVIEEQPYDRFYKKPSDDASIKEESVLPSHSENAYQPKTISESFVKEEPVKKVYEQPIEEKETRKSIPDVPKPSYPSSQPKKKVFVSMPETNAFEPYRDPYKQSNNEEQYQQYLPKSKSQSEQKPQIQQKQLSSEEKYYSPIDIRESEESKLETKYSQSLDDIKEMYINTLVQRKTKNKRKEILKKYVKPALLPLLLVVFGVAIGYFINNKKNTLQASQSISKVVPQQTIPETKKDETPVDENLQPKKNDDLPSEQNQVVETNNTAKIKDKKFSNGQEQLLIPPKQENKNVESLPKAVLSDKKPNETSIANNESALITKKNVEVDPNTGERKKVVRDNDNNNGLITRENNSTNNQASAKKNNSEPAFLESDHKDLRDLVSVKSNTYIRGAFGGIRGLELTVYNSSDFLLDEVSVEVQIMKPSEQPLRTDIITFKNIGANKSITVKVPDSQRGIRVDYRITNIESQQWQKTTAGL